MSTWNKYCYCRSRAYCPTCRTDAAWRAAIGAPDVCPHGFTPETLPARAEAAPVRPRRSERSGDGVTWCRFRRRASCCTPDTCAIDGVDVDDGVCARCTRRDNPQAPLNRAADAAPQETEQ